MHYVCHSHFYRNQLTESQSMSCPALGISILYRLNERGKYNAFALIVFCSFCCATCLGYEPVGKLFDLETTHSIDIKSSHSGRVIPLLVSLLEKKASCQWFSLATASVVHGTATSTSGHAGWEGIRDHFPSVSGSDESLLQGVSPSQTVR